MKDEIEKASRGALAAVLAMGLSEISSDGVAVNPFSRLPDQLAPESGEGDVRPEVSGYEISGRLGHGGMGTVWRAVQLDTNRQVALKLMGVSSFGSHRARQRFEREIELAARLEHPNVARLYDSGARGAICYYAMELVEGQHLDQYVQHKKLNSRQVLALMRDVCRAVQYAHQRGVLHRDLKPSNILVTEDGQPHVVDFGLAKALADEGLDPTLTQEGQYAGTLAFMSPEQAAGKLDQIDTRSDVYGLGATLYLLLAGSPPHDQDGPRYEVLRRVVDEDVRAPRTVNGQIDVELESLLLKALDRDPNRRYGSVEDMARDIERYLNHEPIEASPPSPVYRARKFARKHRIALTIAGLLLVATIISSWQAVRAIRAEARTAQERDRVAAEKKRADDQAAIAEAVNDFFNYELLGEATPKMPVVGGHGGLGRSADTAPDPQYDLKVRDALERAVGGISRVSAGRPLVEAAVRRSIGVAYTRLGDDAKAEPHLLRALEIQRAQLGENNTDTLNTLDELAALYAAQPEPKYSRARAEPVLQQVLEGRRKLLGEAHPDTVGAAVSLAQLYVREHQYARAEALMVPAVAAARQLPSKRELSTLSAADVLAQVYVELHQYARAEPLFEEALNCSRKCYGDNHRMTFAIRRELAENNWMQGGFETAETQLQRILEEQQRLTASDRCECESLPTMDTLASLYIDEGKYALAEPLAIQVWEGWRKTGGDQAAATMNAQTNLAWLYREEGHYDKAERIELEALAAARKAFGEEAPWTLAIKKWLAMIYFEEGHYERAEPLLAQAFTGFRKRYGDDDYDTLDVLHNLAEVYGKRGEYGKAESGFLKAIEGLKRIDGQGSDAVNMATSDLGQLYMEYGRYKKAEPIFREHLEWALKHWSNDKPSTLVAYRKLAELHIRQGRLAEAEPLCRRALEISEKKFGEGDGQTLRARLLLAELYGEQHKYPQTLALCESVLKTVREASDERGKLVEDALRCLGEAYTHARQFAKAQAVLREVLSIERRDYGNEGRNTLAMISWLAGTYWKNDEYDKAEPLVLEWLAGERKQNNVGEMLNAETCLAGLYLHTGRVPQAIGLHEKVRDEYRDQPDLERSALTNLNHLGFAYQQAGRSADAIKVLEETRQRQLREFPPDDPEVLDALHNLAIAYRDAHRTADAIEAFEQLRDLKIKKLGPDDPSTLASMNYLGRVYRDAKRTDDAVELLKRVHDKQIKIIGAEHPNTLNTMMNLGLAYQNAKRMDEAVGVWDQIRIPMVEKKLGFPGDIGPTRGWMIDAYRAVGRTAEVVKLSAPILLEKSAKQKTAALTTRPSDPALLAQRGALYARLSRFREAADDFARAVELAPDNHHYWHEGLVPLLLELGDMDAFHQRLKQELHQFKTTSDGATAHRVSKDALMVPTEGDELTVAVALADRAEPLLKGGSPAWGCQTKGMAEYRSGHYDQAIRWLTEAGKLTSTRSFQAEDDLFLAMSYECLHDHAQAQAALERATRAMDSALPRPGEGDFTMFQDVILCRVVRREAERLIDGNGPSTRPVVSATQPVVSN